MFVMCYTELDEYGKCIVFSTDVNFFFKHRDLWIASKCHIISSRQASMLTKQAENWIVDGPTERIAIIDKYPEVITIFNEIVDEGKIR